jgi:DNA-binding GntR family transcriptional regulator
MENGKLADFRAEARRFGTQPDLARAFFNSFSVQSNAIKTLPEQLAEKLVELIIGGFYAPGQRLHEIKLAEQFGVSRGPVREALRLLERESLVVMASRRGASVARLTAKHLKDIFSVRSALMGVCAEELAERGSAEIQSILDQGTEKLFKASEAGNVGEYIVIVYQLSMFLAEASENNVARTILFSLGRETLPLSRRVFENAGHRQAWANNWRGIVEGVRSGNADAARRAVHKLLIGLKVGALAALAELDAEDRKSASTKSQENALLLRGAEATEQGRQQNTKRPD